MLRSITRRIRRTLGVEKGLDYQDTDLVPAQAPEQVFDLICDGVGVVGKNLDALTDPRFVSAWNRAVELNKEGWHGNVPDIRWRARTACWAAEQALHLDGDFVECGVHTGLLSLTICNYLDLDQTGKKIWLFDTFAGVPAVEMDEREVDHIALLNDNVYFDVLEYAKRNFRPFTGARLMPGILPDTLSLAGIDRISYLSIDLNNASSEKSAIEALWPKLVEGALILLDDYAFKGYEPQHEMWDKFAVSIRRPILTLPSGQGLLIK